MAKEVKIKDDGILTKAETALVEDNLLNEKQLTFLFSNTPEKFVHKRQGRGGEVWSYVKGTYVKKVLNLMFGWDWSFEVVEHKFDLVVGQAYVLGKLTVNTNGKTITKSQFGAADIKLIDVKDDDGKKTGVKRPMDIGNDLKAATTDALKKCASEIGIAADIYAGEEFKQRKVVTDAEKASEMKEHKRIKEFIQHVKTMEALESVRDKLYSLEIANVYIDKFKELSNAKEED